ncbi:MAG: hypothetical protein JOS17DRAFT_823577 [Linnemannia elongata]|nr:MAG: hypothetical protein JOS17DRAFT_823577 [Linnemannia elongata]
MLTHAALTVLVILGGDQAQAAPIPGQKSGHGDRGGDANNSSSSVGVNSGKDSILAGTSNSLAVTSESVIGNAGDRLQ